MKIIKTLRLREGEEWFEFTARVRAYLEKSGGGCGIDWQPAIDCAHIVRKAHRGEWVSYV